jgi:hypothetical protein
MVTRWTIPPPLEKTVAQHVKAALRSLGFVVNDLQQPRRTMQTIGLPDLYAQHAAWQLRVWVEVKRPGGRVSAAQTVWHATERAAGGHVLVVYGVADLLEGLAALGAPLRG